jgi:hypothetical protein
VQAAQSPSFAIITPSYTPDFEPCRLLVESVERHVPNRIKHYVIVDRRDWNLFSQLRSSRTEIVLKQDVLPWWLQQLNFAPKWWLSLRSLPVRGWVIQQLTKLSVNKVVHEDVYLFLDSGAMFVRPFDPASMVKDGKVPLFREQKEEVRLDWNTRWHQVAADLLGLPVQSSYDTNFEGNNPIYWRRDNLTRLQNHIERIKEKDWVIAVCRLQRVSEYVIYGMFVEHILKEAAEQYQTPTARTLSYWSETPMNEAELRAFRAKLAPEDVLVTINEHAKTSTAAIRRAFADV